jgi:dTDP-4-dehydrorhamnose reductase
MKKILVIGASGLIGSRFVELARDKFEIIAVDEKTLDIIGEQAVEEYFAKTAFDVVVNFAAFTNVDVAEKERNDENGLCFKLNVKAVENLAYACKKYNKFLVQISTDFVFTGNNENPGPYDEDAKIAKSMDGVGWYGWSKNRAEKLISESGSRYAIVRIAYPFSSGKYDLKLDFAKNYLKVFDEGKLFPIFTDQTFTPLYLEDMINPLSKILEEELEGVFHIVSSDVATPFDFVEYLLKKARNVERVVQKGSMEEFLRAEGRTPRPRLGGLKTEKTQSKLGIKFRTWREMIDDFVDNL